MNIGEAARASGVSVKMIRYYEGIKLIAPPVRSESGYRVYGLNDIHNLRFIRRARDLGFSVDLIRELVALWRRSGRASSEVKKIATRQADLLKAKIAELQAMVRTLDHLAAHCHGDHRPQCPILDDLADPGQSTGRPQDSRFGSLR